MSDIEVPPKIEYLLNYDTEVIQSVLKHLHLRDLSNAGMVCKTWNTIANKLKIDTSVKITVNGFRDVKSDNYFKNATSTPEQIQPKFSLTIIDTGVYDRHWYYLHDKYSSRKELNKQPKYKKSSVHQKLKETLPENCSSMLLQRPCAMIRYHDATDNLPERLIGYVSLGIPYIPGVQIQPFQMDTDEKNEDIIEIANIDHSLQLKCLLLFPVSNKTDSRLEKLVADINSKQSHPYIDGTFYIKTVYNSQDGRQQSDFIKGIAFSGDNLHVTSILMDAIPDKIYEEVFIPLRDPTCSYHRHNSFALMFYQRQPNINVAMEMFKKQFPNTVLVGVQEDESSRDVDASAREIQHPTHIFMFAWC